MNRLRGGTTLQPAVWTTISLVGLGLLYFPFLQSMVENWNSNDDYSHGYFIPFLSLYFIYCIREELKDCVIRPNSVGLFITAFGLVQLLIGKVGSELFLQRTSLIPVLFGMVLFFYGWEFFKKLFFPIIYLLFMIPLPAILWNKVAFPLQLLASAITENLVYAAGIPIFREGNVLHLPKTTLEVVAACSGLRSLLTMFALSGAIAFLSPMHPGRKTLLFLSAAPIAIAANVLRLSGTAFLATRYGSDVAHGFLHDFSGIVVFVVGLSMLMGVNSLLHRIR